MSLPPGLAGARASFQAAVERSAAARPDSPGKSGISISGGLAGLWQVVRERSAALQDGSNIYLALEALGWLNENSAKVYLTDGGHIDNLGLLQLLKRQCGLIIVVDAEADPSLVSDHLSKCSAMRALIWACA